MGFFDKIKQGLAKTREAISETFNDIFSVSELDDDFYDELESFTEDPNDDLYDLANEYLDEIWCFASDDEYNLPSMDLAKMLDKISDLTSL